MDSQRCQQTLIRLVFTRWQCHANAGDSARLGQQCRANVAHRRTLSTGRVKCKEPDARNHGQSDTHSFSSLPRFAEDLESVLEWLHTNHPTACEKLVLLGHSVGAGAVLLAASRRTDIAAVISVSAFAGP